MKYDVIGVDSKTGEDRSITVEAEGEKDALVVARAKGVLPYSVLQYQAPEIAAGNTRMYCGIASLLLLVFGVFMGTLVSIQFFWLCIIALVPLYFSVDWEEVDRRQKEAIQQEKDRQAQLVCPHCQTKGKVTTRLVSQKAGVSGDKAATAVITGGLSVFVTGLSRSVNVTQANCSNCGSTWHYQ